MVCLPNHSHNEQGNCLGKNILAVEPNEKKHNGSYLNQITEDNFCGRKTNKQPNAKLFDKPKIITNEDTTKTPNPDQDLLTQNIYTNDLSDMCIEFGKNCSIDKLLSEVRNENKLILT